MAGSDFVKIAVIRHLNLLRDLAEAVADQVNDGGMFSNVFATFQKIVARLFCIEFGSFPRSALVVTVGVDGNESLRAEANEVIGP